MNGGIVRAGQRILNGTVHGAEDVGRRGAGVVDDIARGAVRPGTVGRTAESAADDLLGVGTPTTRSTAGAGTDALTAIGPRTATSPEGALPGGRFDAAGVIDYMERAVYNSTRGPNGQRVTDEAGLRSLFDANGWRGFTHFLGTDPSNATVDKFLSDLLSQRASNAGPITAREIRQAAQLSHAAGPLAGVRTSLGELSFSRGNPAELASTRTAINGLNEALQRAHGLSEAHVRSSEQLTQALRSLSEYPGVARAIANEAAGALTADAMRTSPRRFFDLAERAQRLADDTVRNGNNPQLNRLTAVDVQSQRALQYLRADSIPAGRRAIGLPDNYQTPRADVPGTVRLPPQGVQEALPPASRPVVQNWGDSTLDAFDRQPRLWEDLRRLANEDPAATSAVVDQIRRNGNPERNLVIADWMRRNPDAGTTIRDSADWLREGVPAVVRSAMERGASPTDALTLVSSLHRGLSGYDQRALAGWLHGLSRDPAYQQAVTRLYPTVN